ncbi:MAG: hypothetical protein Q7U10_06655 [Thermodesulfovibrionia bacterium]|nr:hypothetical protein [Thermodesulfovibrionia bacterium]
MNFWRAVFLIHIFFVLFLSAEAVSETLPSQAEERLLRSELLLAQKTDIYFILDLEKNRIYFKARGIVLRDLEIKEKRFWGQADTVKLYVMAAKAARSEPLREEVIPENIKKDEKAPVPATTTPVVDLKALELDDMPVSFNLKLGDDLTVSVSPDSKGSIPALSSIFNSLKWYISQPMLTVWHTVKKRPYRVLNLVLDAKDAQALYWSIHEGSEVLIYNPQNH